MNQCDIIFEPTGTRLSVTGATRAGIMTGTLDGFGKMIQPELIERAEMIEHSFKIEASDFTELLSKFLRHALSIMNDHKQWFEGVRFTFMTDKKAEGVFSARPYVQLGHEIKEIIPGSLRTFKRDDGIWQAELKVK